MNRVALTVLFIVILVSCGTLKGEKEMKTNREKVVELLESIENGSMEPVAYINQDKYIQHNLNVADGLEGFGAVLKALNGSGKVNVIRAFQDGDYVFTHTEYEFFGPKVGFDIFRFEDGLIVEHWDNLQEIVTETASGRSQFDGEKEIIDFDKTDVNKTLIKNFVNDILMGVNPDKITDYISTEEYAQHNPGVKDGLSGLSEGLQAMAEAGMPMVFERNHKILGEGNFVLSVSEGQFFKQTRGIL